MVDHDGRRRTVIDVLPAPDVPFTDAVEAGGCIRFSRMRNMYEWTVIDLPAIFQRISLLTLSEADRAFIVSTSDLAMHLTRKAVKLVTQLGLDSQKVQVLINRMDKRNELNTGLTKLFECHVEAAIPNDQLAFQRGVTLGQPLEPDSELGRIVDSLAGKLMGVVPEPKKPQARFAILPLLSHT